MTPIMQNSLKRSEGRWSEDHDEMDPDLLSLAVVPSYEKSANGIPISVSSREVN